MIETTSELTQIGINMKRIPLRTALIGLLVSTLCVAFSADGDQTVILGALKGHDGLLAEPLMGGGELPKALMGVGVSSDGTVYVSETVRQMREELSLLQSRFLHPIDMGFTTVEAKRNWIERNYSQQIAEAQGMHDVNGDGTVDLADLAVRSEKIFTLQDANQDGVFDAATLFADGFNDIVTGVAHSVTPIGDSIYATIIPDLWKLQDKDGDGRAELRERLVHGFANHIGYGNHDLHSVLQAYDGKLYWSMGDRGTNVMSKEGKRWAYPHSGTIVRCNPDGSAFEVVASGLRNCQYFDFDDYGNLFAIDHDADFQGERERLVYLPEGSDSGWRMYYQYRTPNRHMKTNRSDIYNPWLAEKMWVPLHEGQPAHMLPPIENSWNAPASFSYQPGTALGGKYHGHFLLGGVGEIRAFKMVTDGASFRREGEDLLIQGLSNQVLASAFGPDGRMYFVLWKPGKKSPLWALRDSEPQESAVAAMAEVEALSGKGFQAKSTAALLAFLGHADRRIRQEAQFELVARGKTEPLRTLAMNTSAGQLPRLHSLWALGQLKDGNRALLQKLSSDPDPELRAQTARWAGNLGYDPDGIILKLLGDPSQRVQAFAAIATGKLKSKRALSSLVDLIVTADNKIPVLRHAGIAGLAGVASSQDLQAFARHPSTAMRIAAVVALRQRRATVELLPFLRDGSSQVIAEATRALYDEATPDTFTDHPEVLEALAVLLSSKADAAVNVRALAANRRLGTVAAVKRIATFLEAPELSRLERLEALNTLSYWTEATVIDPVDGRYFPLSAFGQEALEVAFGEGLWTLSKVKDEAISQKAIAILAKLKPSDASWQQVVEKVMDGSENEAIRVEWLRWLRIQNSDKFIEVGIAALDAKSTVLRLAAAEELIAANGGEREVQRYLSSTLKGSKDTREMQYALSRLPRVSSPYPVARRLLDQLIDGTLAADLKLDVLEAAAALAETDEKLNGQLERYRAQTECKGPLAQYDAVLLGGDPEVGEALFSGHTLAACSKCHALKSSDKQVGPSLQGIATRHPHSYLLQSLVDPQAAVAPGYGIVTLALKNGNSVTGILMRETSDVIVVKLPDGNQATYSQTAIASKTKPLSTMPDIKGILSNRELRDLVAYLATLH
ncbi:MAG: c-type cytochrome [Opitutales bacterium]|jgi:quinoprotein glucose dehydrogenase|nr:c-type cytochrome [Opitutales bacterium]MBT5169182.1 c-type cytochrome [Opitutales bacterium]MBT5814481.1 c-type cytochrome [Opitutales bacterium]